MKIIPISSCQFARTASNRLCLCTIARHSATATHFLPILGTFGHCTSCWIINSIGINGTTPSHSGWTTVSISTRVVSTVGQWRTAFTVRISNCNGGNQRWKEAVKANIQWTPSGRTINWKQFDLY